MICKKIILLISLIKYSFSYIFEVKKIILSNDISKLYTRGSLQANFYSKGSGLLFNPNSNISFIPYHLFHEIEGYFMLDEQITHTIKYHDDGSQEMIINANIEDNNFETLHFIFENFGITIPLEYFLIKIDNFQDYGLVFFSKENQEYIEIGKDLMDKMDIEFKDEKNFVIHNEEFYTKIDK